jgi:hypothetical protein
MPPKHTKLDPDVIKINNRIKDEICYETINKLKDEKLLEEYKKCASVNNQMNILINVLEKYKIDDDKQKLIINDYILELIPAGTKGVVRGNMFNDIVKTTIENMNLDKNKFEVCFEKECDSCITSEKPDWYIKSKDSKSTNKVIIGMNQLSLWGGGAQSNRGDKYLIDNKYNTDTSKLVCVVCNEIQFNNTSKVKNKTYKLFEIGFANNTLCYLKNLENIIKNYFD